MSNIIPYGRHTITAEDKEAILSVLSGDFLTQGPLVQGFEESIGNFIGNKNTLAVNSGTAALHLAALGLKLKPGQKVLVTPNTFAASANCALYCGADVEFVDIEPDTYCLDLKKLAERLSRAKPNEFAGVICVDFAGFPMDLRKLRKIADEHGLWIIEDTCHAIGAQRKYDNEWHFAGNCFYADASAFSFHPVKHIATGEGGLLATKSRETYETAKLLRTHGITKDIDNSKIGGWYHEMVELGFNYRISDILCALGISQMKRIEGNLERRRQVASIYSAELSELPISLPAVSGDIKHAYHLYVIRTQKRRELYDYLRENNIFTQVHYIPVYQHPYYVKRYGKISLPECDKYYEEALSLPMYHGISDSELEKVIELIRKFYK